MASALYTDIKKVKGKAASMFLRPAEGLFGLRCWSEDPELEHLVAPALARPRASSECGASPVPLPGLRPRPANGIAVDTTPAVSGLEMTPSPTSSMDVPAVPSRTRSATPLKDDAALRHGQETASEWQHQPRVSTPLKRARTPSARRLAGNESALLDGPDGSMTLEESPQRPVRRRRAMRGEPPAGTASGLLMLLRAAETQDLGIATASIVAPTAPAPIAKAPVIRPLAVAIDSHSSQPATPVYPRGTPNVPPACSLLAIGEALGASLGDTIVAQLLPVVGSDDSLLSCALWSFSRKCYAQGRNAEADAAATKAWQHFCKATVGSAHPPTITAELCTAWQAMTAGVARMVPMSSI